MRSFVVASSSPRRHQLLRSRGYDFVIAPAHIDEAARPGETSRVMVMRLALAKALHGARSVQDGSIVLGADTTVDLDGLVIGKPHTVADATRLLRVLSGRTHTVHSGVALVAGDGSRATLDAATSRVAFRHLADAEIADYVASGEPLDKAGAYAIQEQGGAFVANLEGSITNVMGLPMELVEALLGEWGIRPAAYA